jgi:uncharacterized protein (DUF362 family)
MKSNMQFPALYLVKQESKANEVKNVTVVLNTKLDEFWGQIKLKPGQRVAITAGSRGIKDKPAILKELVLRFKALGLEPFIVPAMGSHGGATIKGQLKVLKSLGVEEKTIGAPIVDSGEVVEIGKTQDNIPVLIGKDFLEADHVVVVNRIKPHTDFIGTVESGMIKMMAIGMAKHKGAMLNHKGFIHHGFSNMAEEISKIVLKKLPILMGIGIVENQFGNTACLEVISPSDIINKEKKLLKKAKNISPKIPLETIDCLIVDKMGKEISGTGMDTKVINRIMHVLTPEPPKKKFKRIFVRDLTDGSHGNACGIGLADFTTEKLVAKIDKEVTKINCTLGGSPEKAKIPIAFKTDKEAIEACFNTCGVYFYENARVVWIKNTLKLEFFIVSEALIKEVNSNPKLEVVNGPFAMNFNREKNLAKCWEITSIFKKTNARGTVQKY